MVICDSQPNLQVQSRLNRGSDETGPACLFGEPYWITCGYIVLQRYMKVGWVAKKAHTFSARMLPNAESQQHYNNPILEALQRW